MYAISSCLIQPAWDLLKKNRDCLEGIVILSYFSFFSILLNGYAGKSYEASIYSKLKLVSGYYFYSRMTSAFFLRTQSLLYYTDMATTIVPDINPCLYRVRRGEGRERGREGGREGQMQISNNNKYLFITESRNRVCRKPYLLGLAH
jgi:hypothetical protein